MAKPRMDLPAFVGKLLEEDHGDVLREGVQVLAQALAVAVGVTTDGERHVLGVDAGASEDGAFWTAFLRSLVKRGLRGVRLVISDAPCGTPSPVPYATPRLYWALAFPCSAARRYHRAASASSCGTPSPVPYAKPSLFWAPA